jgi:hypothetical protein
LYCSIATHVEVEYFVTSTVLIYTISVPPRGGGARREEFHEAVFGETEQRSPACHDSYYTAICCFEFEFQFALL